MARLQNTTPQVLAPSPPPQVQQPQSLNLLTAEPIALAEWNGYGFTLPASRIRSWIAKSRVNGIMREGAVLRFGQRYYVNPAQLYGWMNRHGDRTRLTRSTPRTRVRSEETEEARQPSQASGLSPAEQPAQKARPRHQLTEAQVRQARIQLAKATPENQGVVIMRLAKRYGFGEQTIRDAATGHTYQHLPMPTGKKTKTIEAREAAAPA
jgi:transposase-like protein